MRFQQFGHDLDAYAWLPVVGIGVQIFFANWGLLTLPFVVVAEVMPDRMRSTGLMLGTALVFAVGFVLLKTFPLMVTLLGHAGCMFVFAGCSLAAAAFVGCAVPETRGKSAETIRCQMEK